MLLAVDIGNTNITIGIFKNSRLLKRYSIPTRQNGYSKALKKICHKYAVDDAIICSVVPTMTNLFTSEVKRFTGKNPLIIGKDILVPIKNCYQKPRQVGIDRLVNAYAGVVLYGAPLIAVDFGTAVTFDIISRKKEYMGGMILPGLAISLEALFKRTALLPKIKLDLPKELIGRNTKNSMLSGIIYGFAAMTDDLAQRIKKQIGKKAKVVGTGGNINFIRNYCRCFDHINADLTLRGIYLIYKNRLE